MTTNVSKQPGGVPAQPGCSFFCGSRCSPTLVALYPGTPEAYDEWLPFHEGYINTAVNSLADPLQACTASVEFVWRVWEQALVLGAHPSDVRTINVDGVLDALTHRAAILGGADRLLGECVLNRYTMPRVAEGSFATASPLAVGLLNALVPSPPATAEAEREHAHEALSFYFFDRVTERYVRPLHPGATGTIAELLDERAVALRALRQKCSDEADLLLAERLEGAALTRATQRVLTGMLEAAQDVTRADRKSVSAYLSALAEDARIWTAVAGLVGSALALPEVVTAGLALTSLSIVGANAAKASRERKQAIQSSPMRFLYHAQTAFQKEPPDAPAR